MKEHSQQYCNKVDEVVLLLLESKNVSAEKKTRDFLRVIMERFSVSKRMAEYYLESAFAEVSQLGKEKTSEAFCKAMRDREYLYRIAKGKKDWRLALEVVKDRDKIAGLYVDSIKVDEGSFPDLENISTEDLKELLKNG